MLEMRELRGAFNGLEQKIAFIKKSYHDSLTDARIRRFAEDAAGEGDRELQAMRLFNAIKRILRYTSDPVGVEMTKTPSVMMDQMEASGQASGDCDDHAAMAFSMLQSIGIPASLRVAWYGPSKMPQHIYCIANIKGRWIPFDTTRKGGYGTEAPFAKARDF